MFKNLFGNQQSEPQMVMSEGYKNWRGMIFLVTPGQIELNIKEPNKVFGVILDVGVKDMNSNSAFVFTTAVFANGDSTFFPSPGGGVIGLGNNPQVAATSKSIVTMGQIFLARAQPAKENSTASVSRVKFYFLTTSGLFVTEDSLKAFQSGPYGQLLGKFGQIRAVAEQMIDKRLGKK